MAPVAGVALGAGKLRLTGRAPNGQRFIANPLLTWTVPSAKAIIDGRNLGAVAPLQEQPKLGDFWIPRTGLFAIGRAFFDAFDPEIHSAATSRTESASTLNHQQSSLPHSNCVGHSGSSDSLVDQDPKK